MAKYYDVGLRNRAIGIVQAGMPLSQVAKKVGAPLRIVQGWWKHFKTYETLDDTPRFGRPTSLSKVAKLVMRKAVGRKRSIGDQTCTTFESKRPSGPRQISQALLEKRDGLKSVQNKSEAEINRKTSL